MEGGATTDLLGRGNALALRRLGLRCRARLAAARQRVGDCDAMQCAICTCTALMAVTSLGLLVGLHHRSGAPTSKAGNAQFDCVCASSSSTFFCAPVHSSSTVA